MGRSPGTRDAPSQTAIGEAELSHHLIPISRLFRPRNNENVPMRALSMRPLEQSAKGDDPWLPAGAPLTRSAARQTAMSGSPELPRG
jgi:hypothetical protein